MSTAERPPADLHELPQADPHEQSQEDPREQPKPDLREQVVKFSTVLEQALDKPRLDTVTMREQILCTPNPALTKHRPC